MEGRMQEGKRNEERPVTQEQLVRAFEKDDKNAAEHLLLRWRIEQLEKRIDTDKPEEMLQAYLDTAATLAAIGLVNDARESYEDIADTAERFNEPDLQQKALDALANLPTVH
jgi:hypothetical protein